ncbi:MAG: DUF4112 domain-containing protein [Gammaproteobacteria bacterium]
MSAAKNGANAARLRRLQALARLMDDSIPVPVINKRIGIDSVIGLVPVVGDLAGGSIALYILYNGYRLGASFATLMRMLGNVVLEMIVGAVPLLGDLFDMAFKANLRNVNLLMEHAQDRRGVERESAFYTVLFVLSVASLLVGAVVLTVAVAVIAFKALAGLF